MKQKTIDRILHYYGGTIENGKLVRDLEEIRLENVKGAFVFTSVFIAVSAISLLGSIKELFRLSFPGNLETLIPFIVFATLTSIFYFRFFRVYAENETFLGMWRNINKIFEREEAKA